MPYKDPIKAMDARDRWKKANAEKQRGYVKKSKAKHDAKPEVVAEKAARSEVYKLQLAEWARTRPAREAEKKERHNRMARERRAEKARLEGRPLGRKLMTDDEKLEKKAIHRKNRRYRERNATGKLSAGIRGRLLKLQKGLCAACKNKLILSGGKKHHLDHIVPIAGGGTNSDVNIQLLCCDCNMAKGSKDGLVFMQSKGYLL